MGLLFLSRLRHSKWLFVRALCQLLSIDPNGDETENWTLPNTKGSRAANLSRVVLHRDAADFIGFDKVRVAATRVPWRFVKSDDLWRQIGYLSNSSGGTLQASVTEPTPSAREFIRSPILEPGT